MELIAEYLKIQKKPHPLLHAFFKSEKLPAWQKKLLEERPVTYPYFQMARRSGKTGAHMALLQHYAEQHERSSGTVPRLQIRVSNEMLEDMQSPLSEAINNMARRVAQERERQLYESIMRGVGIDPESFQPAHVARGQRSVHMFFDTEYYSDWAGDSGGDVPSVPTDPTST